MLVWFSFNSTLMNIFVISSLVVPVKNVVGSILTRCTIAYLYGRRKLDNFTVDGLVPRYLFRGRCSCGAYYDIVIQVCKEVGIHEQIRQC